MTEAQRKRFYFPNWHRACEAQGWRMEKGRFTGRRNPTHGVPDVDALYQAIWDTAEKLARQAHCAVTAEHLRHACHVAAVGRDKSANDLTNAEVDAVVNIFRLLTDPDDLDAIIGVQHPENNERRRLVFTLKKRAPEATLLAIAKNLQTWSGEWEPPFWEDMPLAGLKTLVSIISREQREWNAPVAREEAKGAKAAKELASIEQPG